MDTEFLSEGMKIFSNQIVMMFEQSHESTKKKKKIEPYVYFFWLCHTTCGISVPQPGVEPRPEQ